MDESARRKIAEIMGQMDCPKAFKCAKTGFEALCKAEDIGLDSMLKCLETYPMACKFAVPFGHGHFCQCPLRVFVAKSLGR